ncbi:MAG: RnfABCDGE type electron transport complex subunit G [Pseudomonadota bacterium]
MKYVTSVLVLTIICITASLLLSQVYSGTKDRIEENERIEALKQVKRVLEGLYDNDLEEDSIMIGETKVFRGKKGGELTSIAFSSFSKKGYSGLITIMVGIDPEGSILGVQIVSHTETPGLGTKACEEQWLGQFKGKNLDSSTWKVRKDSAEGLVDEVTGATVSSRAITEATARGLEFFKENADAILQGD